MNKVYKVITEKDFGYEVHTYADQINLKYIEEGEVKDSIIITPNEIKRFKRIFDEIQEDIEKYPEEWDLL